MSILKQENKRVFPESGFNFTLPVDVPVNTIVAFGGMVGITTMPVPKNTLGYASSQGTFALTNAAYAPLTYAQGDAVKITVANNIGTVATAGTIQLGYAAASTTAGDTTVQVMIHPA